MNFGTTNAQVEQHMQDIRREVARCRSRSSRRGRVAKAGAPPRLRSRVGFTLIEAGLRLLAADHAARTYSSRPAA